jgi:hypothetical protein
MERISEKLEKDVLGTGRYLTKSYHKKVIIRNGVINKIPMSDKTTVLLNSTPLSTWE